MNDAVPQRPQSDLAAESDDDLLLYMSWHGDDPDTACAALGELYRRHVQYLYGVCLKAYGDTLKVDGVKDLVLDTFKRALEKASTFTPSGFTDRGRMCRRVRGWLGAIATNLVRDRFRAQAGHAEKLLVSEQWERLADKGHEEPSDEVLLVREGMASVLNEREREVLRLTFHYYDPERPHQRLPDDAASELAQYLGTTADNLRKIRASAISKMKDFLVASMAGPSPARQSHVRRT